MTIRYKDASITKESETVFVVENVPAIKIEAGFSGGGLCYIGDSTPDGYLIPDGLCDLVFCTHFEIS